LDDVIAEKKIPYRANSSWLETLHKRAPGKFMLTELKRSELQTNYLFHESGHFLAHSVFFKNRKPQKLPKNSDTLFKILIGEAFANTVEALSYAFVEGEIGNYFLDVNCHFRLNSKETAVLHRVIKKLGLAVAARTLFAAFLYSNFMYEKINERELARISEFVGADAKTIRPLVKIGLLLSTEFRSTTTQLHLLKLGFSDPGKWMKEDPIARLSRNTVVRKQTDVLMAFLSHN
jgi:hypothetical protein